MLEKIDATRYVYRNKEGKEFTMKRWDGAEWHTLQIGNIVRMSGKFFKIVEIAPREVILEDVTSVQLESDPWVNL